jgi:hypothetical protein
MVNARFAEANWQMIRDGPASNAGILIAIGA